MTILINLLPKHAYASIDKSVNQQRRKINFGIEGNYNSSSVTTTTSDTTLSGSSAVSTIAAEVGADYFISERFTISGQFFFALMTDIQTEMTGYSIGSRYYYLNPGYKYEASIMGNLVTSSPKWAPYIFLGFANRGFQFSNVNITFQGYEIEPGLDWHISDEYLLRAALFYQSLSNTTRRSYTTTGLGFGISYAY